MNKFTIFTIILSVSVIVVVADLSLRDYYEASGGRASVFGSGEEVSPVILDTGDSGNDENETEDNSANEPLSAPAQERSVSTDQNTQSQTTQILPPPSSRITANIIREAGYSGVLTEKPFNGKVFQLLDITRIPVDGVAFYDVLENGVGITSITEIVLRDEIRALQMYILLQNKTKTYIDLSLNETNAYGDRSFYINHARKPDEAFLTVKIGRSIYAFAYVKTYHSQIKKLIQLLSS